MIEQISPIYKNTEDLLEEYYLLSNVIKEDDVSNFDIAFRLHSILYELEFRNSSKNLAPTILTIPKTHKAVSNCSILEEIDILKHKYLNENYGRVKPPINAQEMWSSYKYSIMARDNKLYKEIGQSLSDRKTREEFEELARILIIELKKGPSKGGIKNALQHMWGYISNSSQIKKSEINDLSLKELYREIQDCVRKVNEPYLMKQTAMSELGIWIDVLELKT